MQAALWQAPSGTMANDVLPVWSPSFAFIGSYWNNHHHLLRATDRISGAVMWANLHLPFWLSLLPIFTSWVGAFPGHSLPAAGFGAVGLAAAIAYYILGRAIVRANDRESRVALAIGSDIKGRLSLLIYAAGVGLALETPFASYVLHVVVALMCFAPDRRLAPSSFADAHHRPDAQ